MLTTKTARRSALTLVIAALTLGSAGLAHAAPGGSPRIPLNTGQETPAPSGGGARGTFAYEIDGSELCYTIKATGLTTSAVAAHIHREARNVAGPIVVPLVVPAETSFETSACVTSDPALLAAIQTDPSAYYLNVHTSMNTRGEIRGQLK